MKGTRLIDFLNGVTEIEDVESVYNGRVSVVRDLAWGTYIKAGGLTQSGGVAKKVWKTALKKVKNQMPDVRSSFILGLGGGSVADLIKKYWEGAEVTGVDIDSVMVDLGKKYLKMPEDTEIIIGDAEKEVKSKRLEGKSFDLICVDIYAGDNFPEKFQTDDFLMAVYSLLNKSGVIVFNRLYYGEKRKEAYKFGEKLERMFGNVDRFYPEANVMFVITNDLPAGRQVDG